MSNCADKIIAQKLYAYELGLLSEEEQHELEIHLLKCEACFAEFQQVKETAKLLRSDSEIQDDIGMMAMESADTRRMRRPGPRWKSE